MLEYPTDRLKRAGYRQSTIHAGFSPEAYHLWFKQEGMIYSVVIIFEDRVETGWTYDLAGLNLQDRVEYELLDDVRL